MAAWFGWHIPIGGQGGILQVAKGTFDAVIFNSSREVDQAIVADVVPLEVRSVGAADGVGGYYLTEYIFWL